ncbi:glycosyltransferase family 4 protein [Bacillus salacetis]|uniref:glycosyltransferase family 4 protein n=1 Tax=Bacillus salacetis TaxID=2315464 RepID=UPI003B9E70DD
MANKKILYVCTVDSMIWNFLVPHIRELESSGYTVECACSSTGEIINALRDEHGLVVHEINIKRSPVKLTNFKGLIQLINIIKKGNFDLIHAHEPVGGVIGRLAGRFCKKEVFYTAHGFHFHPGGKKLNNAIYYSIEKFMSFFTDKLFVMNNYDYKMGKKMYGENNVSLIHGVGVDIERFQNDQSNLKERLDIRLKCNFAKNDIVIGTVAEFIPRKRYIDFLYVAQRLIKLNSNYKFLMVGTGEKLEEMKQLAKELRITQNCIFAGYCKNVIPYFNAMDLFLFTSNQEGLPRAVMEAMAIGKPIVASKIRGNEDLIVDGVTGFLVPVGDIDQYVIKIEEALNTPDIGIKAKERIINNFSTSKVIEEIIVEY